MTVLPQDYLRTLVSIRERCNKVYEKSQRGELTCFDVDESAFPAIVDHVAATTTRRYPQLDQIPPHSRLRHFNPVQMQELKESWDKEEIDPVEKSRRLIDLVIVSVLVDAGAGQKWKYKSSDGEFVGRSEGLALASFDMFASGYFSSSETLPGRVDGKDREKYTYKCRLINFLFSPRTRPSKYSTHDQGISSHRRQPNGRFGRPLKPFETFG